MKTIGTVFQPLLEILTHLSLVVFGINLFSPIIPSIVISVLMIITFVYSAIELVTSVIGLIKGIREQECDIWSIISFIAYIISLVCSAVCIYYKGYLIDFCNFREISIYVFIATSLVFARLVEKVLTLIPDIIAAFVIDEYDVE